MSIPVLLLRKRQASKPAAIGLSHWTRSESPPGSQLDPAVEAARPLEAALYPALAAEAALGPRLAGEEVAHPFAIEPLLFLESPAGMIGAFITSRSAMARRTVNLPDSVEALARESAQQGESFSATVARLIEAGARATRDRSRPRYVGSGEGPDDLGRLAERYLRELVTAH